MPDLARRTLELVDLASESRHEAALARHLLSVLPDARDAGDTCVLAGVAERGARPLVLLGGHLDTVPAQDNRPGRRADGAVHGLGASDMKGALAVMVELALAEAGGAVDLGYVFFGREELPVSESALAPLPAGDERGRRRGAPARLVRRVRRAGRRVQRAVGARRRRAPARRGAVPRRRARGRAQAGVDADRRVRACRAAGGQLRAGRPQVRAPPRRARHRGRADALLRGPGALRVRLNPVLTGMQTYPFVRLREAAAARGTPMIDLGIGEPREETPAFIRRALVAALEDEPVS